MEKPINPFLKNPSEQHPTQPERTREDIFYERQEARAKPLRRKVPEQTGLADKEKIFVYTNIYAYLSETPGREKLCKDLFSCDKKIVEPVLLDDLHQIIAEEGEAATATPKVHRLRGMIRALSIHPDYENNRISPDELLRKVNPEHRLKEDYWQKLEKALASNVTGKELEPIVRDTEKRYEKIIARWIVTEDGPGKKHLLDDIERLRPLRDQLYFRRLYPLNAKAKLETTTIYKNDRRILTNG